MPIVKQYEAQTTRSLSDVHSGLTMSSFRINRTIRTRRRSSQPINNKIRRRHATIIDHIPSKLTIVYIQSHPRSKGVIHLLHLCSLVHPERRYIAFVLDGNGLDSLQHSITSSSSNAISAGVESGSITPSLCMKRTVHRRPQPIKSTIRRRRATTIDHIPSKLTIVCI